MLLGVKDLMTSTISVLDDPIRKEKVTKGIKFLLSHFKAAHQQLFPRKMSTTFSECRQFVIWNEIQILQECEKANYVDCRLNAYPIIEGEHIAPSVIFIDIDGDSKHNLDKILKQTLKTIKLKLNNYKPTILWTGNGYHVYIILDTSALELIPKLTELCSEPSRLFFKFAESRLANRRSDFKHNPSFKSCLLRIPGTLNSKCPVQSVEAEVKIMEKFQGSVPFLGSTLMHDFGLYLADIDIKSKRELLNSYFDKYHHENGQPTHQQYEWIEKLLLTPIPDCRKYTIDLVLAPYLIVIKKIQEKEAFTKIKYWIEQCNKIRPLMPSLQYFENRIIEAVDKCVQKKIPPISLKKLRQNKPLFENLKANPIERKCISEKNIDVD
jgi:hypothetical protein